jgi:hypothetical protein
MQFFNQRTTVKSDWKEIQAEHSHTRPEPLKNMITWL